MMERWQDGEVAVCQRRGWSYCVWSCDHWDIHGVTMGLHLLLGRLPGQMTGEQFQWPVVPVR